DLAAPYDVELTTPAPAPEVPATTLPPPPPPQPVAPSTPAPTTTPSTTTSTTAAAAAAASAASSSVSTARATTRSRNVIFPSVKNKPTLANTSFTTDALQGIKDVKGYSCLDLQNAGMRDSGVYYLQIRGTTYWFLKVFCEQDAGDGGWT
ncbi:Techylectin-5B, partial [Gryllus bimaculatus]